MKMEIFNSCSGRDRLLLMAISFNALRFGMRMLSNTHSTITEFNVLPYSLSAV